MGQCASLLWYGGQHSRLPPDSFKSRLVMVPPYKRTQRGGSYEVGLYRWRVEAERRWRRVASSWKIKDK